MNSDSPGWLWPDELSCVSETPALIFDEGLLSQQLDRVLKLRQFAGVRILYSIKALPLISLIELLLPGLDGLSVSSLFEAQLAGEIVGPDSAKSLHFTSPGLRASDMELVGSCCDYLSFNSLEQFHRLEGFGAGRVSMGIRVNPGYSFLGDSRYDPCRPHSKLGVPVADLALAFRNQPALRHVIEGLHFHTAFESSSYSPLAKTLSIIKDSLRDITGGLRWINLGGGYLFNNDGEVAELAEIMADWQHLEVFIEPGKGLVGGAGFLVTTVIDQFVRDDKNIAVLDTGVHHLPEVFEYQKSPAVAGHHPSGSHAFLLAGCTCLAGDVFGEYRFDRPLSVGDRIIFRNVGAYSMVKASRFNGFDLPSVFIRRSDGTLQQVKRHGYGAFRMLWQDDSPTCASADMTLSY